MDHSQFQACYAAFPDPLFLQTPEGTWLTTPAADSLALSPAEFDLLAAWDGSPSIWLARQFFYIHGHRTSDGLFLLLSTDTFFSSGAVNLSSQLRQRLSQAFNGVTALQGDLPPSALSAQQGLSEVYRSLFQIFRIATELERCAASELSCHKVCLDLNQWLDCLTVELRHWCPSDSCVTLRTELPSAPLTAMADLALLDCLVTHLVSNAIKAVAPEEAEIVLSLKKSGDQAVLTVSCNATAFSPAVLNDPLWNQPTRLLPGRGLGLGLPIAQRIAALHGGALMASHTQEGSQVALSLPTSIPEGYLASPALRSDVFDEFSQVRVILSDALPPSAFRLDHSNRS